MPLLRNDIREAARTAIEDALYVFGDQAGELACTLFDEVCEREGIDAQATLITDAISREMMDEKLHYFAGRLVKGDVEGFDRKVSDLTRFYVKRTAYENMVRNCDANDVRYARVPSGLETCGFCFMLASRGFDYHSEVTARGDTPHGMHDHCDCIIVPGEKDVTVIDGYDPEGMRHRLSQCERALGGNAGIKQEWESLTEEERSKYKGDNDEERYERFKRDRIIREVESRDWKWLYTGTTRAHNNNFDIKELTLRIDRNIDYSQNPRSNFGQLTEAGNYDIANITHRGKEWADIFPYDTLALAGFKIIARSPNAPKHYSNIDAFIDGELFEFKSPKGGPEANSKRPFEFIDKNLKKAYKQFQKQYDPVTKGKLDYKGNVNVVLNLRYRPIDENIAVDKVKESMIKRHIDRVMLVLPNGKVIDIKKEG